VPKDGGCSQGRGEKYDKYDICPRAPETLTPPLRTELTGTYNEATIRLFFFPGQSRSLRCLSKKFFDIKYMAGTPLIRPVFNCPDLGLLVLGRNNEM
jgi:hypothetical protein